MKRYAGLLLMLSIFVVLCAIHAPAAGATEKAIIVFDASGSMWGEMGGRTKIEIARETMAKILADWNPDTLLGITAYGHRRKGDCGDIEPVVPLGKVDAAKAMSVINALNPKGMTPISAALRQAAEELGYTKDKATIILVSDGEETCNADPCEVASELEKAGIDFTVHVIGFGIKDEEQKQLTCVAQNTGGNFYRANDAASLKEAMEKTVKRIKGPAGEGRLWIEGPTEFYSGNPVTVHFEASASFDKKAWAGMVPSSVPHGSEKLNDEYDTSWEYIDNRTSGTVTLPAGPTVGDWDVRLHDSNDDGFEVASVKIKVKKAVGKVWLDKSDFVTGERMNVHFEVPAELNPKAWAGIVPANIEHGSEAVNDQHDISWEYLDGRANGTLAMLSPAKTGKWDVRLNDFNGNGNEFAYVTFNVTMAKGEVSIDKGQYSPGETIAVKYNVYNLLSPKAWAGVVPSDIEHGSEARNDNYDTSWEYLGGASGSLKLRAPDKPGRYDVRVHDSNDDGNEIAFTSFVVK